ARMHGRSLNDRAARRDEPVKALAPREPSDRSRFVTASADDRDRVELAPDDREIDAGVEREEPGFVELDQRIQIIEARARQDHAGVDELGALDLRHDADHRVVISMRVHGWPLRRKRAAREAGSTDTRSKSAASRPGRLPPRPASRPA